MSTSQLIMWFGGSVCWALAGYSAHWLVNRHFVREFGPRNHLPGFLVPGTCLGGPFMIIAALLFLAAVGGDRR